jgi:hypothetical protein
MLRVAGSIYSSWLEHASYREQARELLRSLRKDGYAKIGTFVAKTLAPLLRSIEPTGLLSSVVEDGLTALVTQHDAQGNPVATRRVSTEVFANLLSLVSELSSGRHMVVLVSDFDRVAEPLVELATLSEYLDAESAWPSLHMVLGVTDPPGQSERESDARERAVTRELARFENHFSPLIRSFPLGPLDLSAGEDARAVINYLRRRVPAAANVANEELIAELGGYAGTLWRWVTGQPKTREELVELAAQARNAQFEEIPGALGRLSGNASAFALATRIILLPALLSDEVSRSLADLVLGDSEPRDMDLLVQEGLLIGDPDQPLRPSLGPATRHEAAREHLANVRWKRSATAEAEALIVAIASTYGDRDVPVVGVLTELRDIAGRLGVSGQHLALCKMPLMLESEEPEHASEAAAAEIWQSVSDDDLDLACGLALEHNAVAPLVTAAFGNRILYASDADFLKYAKAFHALASLELQANVFAAAFGYGLLASKTGDSFFADRLRRIVEYAPREFAPRLQLAELLADKLKRDVAARTETLNELRKLAASSGSHVIRGFLCTGLTDVIRAQETNDRSQLIAELRELATSFGLQPYRHLLLDRMLELTNERSGEIELAAAAKACKVEPILADVLAAILDECTPRGVIDDLKRQRQPNASESLLEDAPQKTRALVCELAKSIAEFERDNQASIERMVAQQKVVGGTPELYFELRDLANHRFGPLFRTPHQCLAGALEGVVDVDAPEAEACLDELRTLVLHYPEDAGEAFVDAAAAVIARDPGRAGGIVEMIRAEVALTTTLGPVSYAAGARVPIERLPLLVEALAAMDEQGVSRDESSEVPLAVYALGGALISASKEKRDEVVEYALANSSRGRLDALADFLVPEHYDDQDLIRVHFEVLEMLTALDETAFAFAFAYARLLAAKIGLYPAEERVELLTKLESLARHLNRDSAVHVRAVAMGNLGQLTEERAAALEELQRLSSEPGLREDIAEQIGEMIADLEGSEDTLGTPDERGA